MRTTWDRDRVLELATGYRRACVIAAAADLEVFDVIGKERLSAPAVARRIKGDVRATSVLLDALAALELLRKSGDRYSVPSDVGAVLTANAPHGVLAMTQHHANCMRRWAQLARVVKTGRPALREPSVRGSRKDEAAFIGGMHDLNSRLAATLVRKLQPLPFRHLLDVGGASGTWTLAFLEFQPGSTATLFDLPHVVPMARRRIGATPFAGRVDFASGDFLCDPLPAGADLAWVSAIVHQNSRQENRQLFRKVRRALVPGGRIAIRDVVMENSRTRPVPGALFAVNMLVGTDGGGTYTYPELAADLRSAGFRSVHQLLRGEGNDSVVMARR